MSLPGTPKRIRSSPDINPPPKISRVEQTVESPIASQSGYITEEEMPTTQTRKTTRPKTVKKPSTPSVKSIIDSLSDPDSPFIMSIANALKKHISDAIKHELEPHLAQIRKLTHEVHEKEQMITELEQKVDNIEQYMRRDCLTVTGIKESLNENTDELIIDMAKSKLNVELTPTDISRSHRIPGGPPRPDTLNNGSPRAIIVKFATYNARKKVYSSRRLLKDSPDKMFINEVLTRKRSALAFQARQLIKQRLIQQTWTSDGKILVKTNYDKIEVVWSEEDLKKYHK